MRWCTRSRVHGQCHTRAIAEMVCCLRFANIFYFFSVGLWPVSPLRNVHANIFAGGTLSLGRIHKTHLRPSCSQSACAIKSIVYTSLTSLPGVRWRRFYCREDSRHSLRVNPIAKDESGTKFYSLALMILIRIFFISFRGERVHGPKRRPRQSRRAANGPKCDANRAYDEQNNAKNHIENAMGHTSHEYRAPNILCKCNSTWTRWRKGERSYNKNE